MGKINIWKIAVKAIAIITMTAVVAGIAESYIQPVTVLADAKYQTLYDVFRDRSGKPDSFMGQEEFRNKILSNCNALNGVAYTSGQQQNYLACDGFVSLVLRMTFGTVHEVKKNYEWKKKQHKISFKFNTKEEHIVADSYVDRYEIYRPGGTSVTWLYKNYVGNIVNPISSKRKNCEDMTNKQWVEYLEQINAQPGDILFWDNDKNDKYWTHIGIFAGIENGTAKMWHASAVKKKVCKQDLSEITEHIRYLKYVCVLPMTDAPAKVGLCIGTGENDRDFSYSVYKDEACSNKLGRISSSCTLKEQSSLENLSIYFNSDKSAYEKTLYVKRDISPYKASSTELSGTDQIVYKLKIKITPGEENKGTLVYTVYGAEDIRYYSGKTIEDYDFRQGGQVIEISDFR